MKCYTGEMYIVASKLCAVGECLELRGTWHARFVPLFMVSLGTRSVHVCVPFCRMSFVTRSVQVLCLYVGLL